MFTVGLSGTVSMKRDRKGVSQMTSIFTTVHVDLAGNIGTVVDCRADNFSPGH